MLSKADILKSDDLPRATVSVPEWGGEVMVRGLTGSERDAWEAETFTVTARGVQSVNLRDMRARLVARCVVDEAGQRVFGDADVVALGAKSAQALQRVFEAAQRLSGLTAADIEELKGN